MEQIDYEKNQYDDQYVLCHHCDLLVEIPRVTNQHKAICPRCKTRLTRYRKDTNKYSLVYALCALFMLFAACTFFMINIRVVGSTNNMSILMVPETLWLDNYAFLAVIFVCFVILFPTLCLTILVLLCGNVPLPKRLKIFLLVWLEKLQYWCMAEIFLAGILVSFVKLTSYGDIGINTSFIPYCLFIFLQLKALSLFSYRDCWRTIGPTMYVSIPFVAGRTGMSQNLRLCRSCQAILHSNVSQCPRCLQKGVVRDKRGIQWTIALLITSIVLYIPANMYAIMSTLFVGSLSESTIMDGVIFMWQEGDYPVALVIFSASIVIPVLKIIALSLLCYFSLSVSEKAEIDCLKMNRLYNMVEFIGRWSMIDIFVVAVISALIRNGELMAVYPSVGALFFASVVIITMIASDKYDPRLIWDRIKVAG